MRICALPHLRWNPRVILSSTLTVGRDAIDLPRQRSEPAHIFVMPERDLFHQAPTLIEAVFDVMNSELRHEFQVATANIERAAWLAPTLRWSPNIWLGALVEDDASVARIVELRKIPAHVRFAHVRTHASVPEFDVDGLDFIIVEAAGEPRGLVELNERCEAKGTRVFVGPRIETASSRDHRTGLGTMASTAPSALRRR